MPTERLAPNQVKRKAYNKFLRSQDPGDSEYAAYTQGLKQLRSELDQTDQNYKLLQTQADLLKSDDKVIENCNPQDRRQRTFLKAYKMINMVQDKVRQQMIDEMKVADEESREKRL